MEELENDGRAAAYACHHCYTSSNFCTSFLRYNFSIYGFIVSLIL